MDIVSDRGLSSYLHKTAHVNGVKQTYYSNLGVDLVLTQAHLACRIVQKVELKGLL